MSQKTPLKVMVFIPARNESNKIAEVIGGVSHSIIEHFGCIPEIVVGDDGSTDGTRHIAEKEGAIVLHHEEAIGLGNNFKYGVEYVLSQGVDILLTIDGDGQFSPDDIPKLISPIINSKADFVSGSRFLDDSVLHNMPLVKRWGNYGMSWLLRKIIGKNYRDVSCGFRAYSREALLRLSLFGGFTYTQEVFLDLSYKRVKTLEVPIVVRYFPDRKSRIAHNLARYGWQTFKIIVSSMLYYRPMRFFAPFSLFFLVPGVFIFSGLFIRFFYYGVFTPYKFLLGISIGLMTMGIMLLVIGLFLQFFSRIQANIDNVLYYAKKGR